MKRVLIVGDEHLLGSGIESLLERESNVQVQSISSCDSSVVDQQIEIFAPDVLVLDETWKQPIQSPLIELLDKFPGMKAIVINNSDNSIRYIFQKKIMIVDAHDLVEAIRDN